MTYPTLAESAQRQLRGGVATSIRVEGEWSLVRYHRTYVVRFNEKTVVLDSGGWRTATTKRRMNQVSTAFNLGVNVWQNRGEWFASDSTGEFPFSDGMTLCRTPMAWDGEEWTACH
jgi:hypothetical protein